MNEAQARKLETETEWNGKANVCIHCGRVPETFYIVTGHDHTDDSIRWCICRERYSQSEKHALLKENAALRAEVERLSKLAYIGEHQFDDNTFKHRVNELRQQLAASQLEAKRLREALDNHSGNYKLSKAECAVINQLLEQPTPTEALDAYVAEKVKEAIDSKAMPDDYILQSDKLASITRQRNLAVSALQFFMDNGVCEATYYNVRDALAAIKESET